MKHKTLALISLPLVAGVVLAGCSSSDDTLAETTLTPSTTVNNVDPASESGDKNASSPASQTRQESDTTSASTDDPSDEGAVMMGTASTGPTSYTEPALSELWITDVRVGAHEGFDRIVFEYEGSGTPGYHAGYTDQPLQQASGYPVDVAGQAVFEIMIHGTPMGLGDLDSPLTKAGPMDLQAGYIQGVTHGGVFEADTQYFVGLDRERPYSVTLLENPTRVVVDFQH